MDFNSYQLASVNINNITNQTKLDALSSFLRLNDIDIAFLQEVENSSIQLTGYTLVFNIDSRKRGVAFAFKPNIEYTSVECSLDGRLITMRLKNGVTLCNIYAPTGAQSNNAREDFFNLTCAYYLRNCSGPIVMGGDFNSVVNQRDATGATPRSGMTSRLMTSLNLIDVWRCLRRNDTDYTFVRAGSGSRLDRFLLSRSSTDWLRTIRHAVNCFSDHKAVIMRMVLPITGPQIGRGIWRLNAHVLDDEETFSQLQHRWPYIVRQQPRYRSWSSWWIDFAKPKISSFLRWRTSILLQDTRNTMNLLDGELARAYQLYVNDPSQLSRINRIKSIMLLKQRESTNKWRQLNETYLQGEPTSLYHLSEKHSNRSRTIIRELESGNNVINDGAQIEQTVVSYFEDLFQENNQTNATNNFIPSLRIPDNNNANEKLMDPIECEEIFQSIRNSCSRKSPGEDGLPKEFYVKCWNVIQNEFTLVLNDFLQNPNMESKMMNGIVVLVKKKGSCKTIEGYRPITLLNFDYKILTRILKRRMTPLMDLVLSKHQKCSKPQSNIFQATGKILDKIASLKHSRQPSLLVSFDLDHAFDRVKHSFLLQTMQHMNFNGRIIELIQRIMRNSCSKLLINGKLSRPLHISRSVRQGDPLSMFLFVLYMQPLIDKIVSSGLAGDTLNVYADDISIFVPDYQVLQQIVRIIAEYRAVAGAVLNLMKTFALKIGDIPAHDSVPWLNVTSSLKILGIHFSVKTKETMDRTWTHVIKNMKWRLWMGRARSLNLIQKVILINTFVSSKLWYTASTLPLPKKFETQILKEYRNFLWIGGKTPIPLETLFLPKTRGGLNLHSPGLKAVSLLVNRILQHLYDLPFLRSCLNTDNVLQIPAAYPQVKVFALEVATLSERALLHHSSSVIYNELLQEERDPPVLSGNRQWSIIFKNVLDRRLSSAQQSVWYTAIHGKIATNEMLFKQHRRTSPNCHICPGVIDTVKHRIFECQISKPVWIFAMSKIALLWPLLSRKKPEYFLFPELRGIPSRVAKEIKLIFAKFVSFICNTTEASINVDNFRFEL